MRLEGESVVLKNAYKELEERLCKQVAQMRQVIDNKLFLSVVNKGNQFREKEIVLNELIIIIIIIIIVIIFINIALFLLRNQ